MIFFCSSASPTFPGASMHFGSTFLSRLRMMLVGIWLGLHWASFSFFDHYIQSSGHSTGCSTRPSTRCCSRRSGWTGSWRTRALAVTVVWSTRACLLNSGFTSAPCCCAAASVFNHCMSCQNYSLHCSLRLLHLLQPHSIKCNRTLN